MIRINLDLSDFFIMKKKILLFLSLLTACTQEPEKVDPHAEFNRDMLTFNLAADEKVLRPAAIIYKEATHDGIRESISNALVNIKEPYFIVNYLAAGDLEYATNSLFRFVINSTIGLLGLFDVGSKIGLEKAETSYKETLHTLNVPTGDYIVLPIFGFSSTRDAIAEPISWFADPVGYVIGIPYMLLKAVLYEVSNRAENAESIDRVIKDSMDLYSSTKNMYFQKYGVNAHGQTKDEFADSPSPED